MKESIEQDSEEIRDDQTYLLKLYVAGQTPLYLSMWLMPAFSITSAGMEAAIPWALREMLFANMHKSSVLLMYMTG